MQRIQGRFREMSQQLENKNILFLKHLLYESVSRLLTCGNKSGHERATIRNISRNKNVFAENKSR